VLKFSNLALRRGPRLLFEDVNFTIHADFKVGITGANGTGKSSLFGLILGELHADAGDLLLPSSLSIAHLSQETPAVNTAAIEYVMDGDQELRLIQQALTDAASLKNGHKQAELHERLEAVDGYTARSRAARLMHGLGFTPDQDEIPVQGLSGGWRVRLNLAQTLMCRSDLLLLDEPTNHLDLDAVIWLEDWLRSYPGTLMLISHDREFLDRVTDHTAHIEHKRMTLYSGNYSAFEIQRAALLANQHAAYEKQQREIEHIQQFIQRFRAKATKARQAQSRIKALQRMEHIAPAHIDSQFQFAFPTPEKMPSLLLRLEDLAIGYANKSTLDSVNLDLLPGQRIGLLGHNGAGKSTLVKALAGELIPLAGQREPARDLHIGYFAQHQLEQLDAKANPLLHLQRIDNAASEQKLRNHLGGFGFSGDRVEGPVGLFSGGEKARLVLAMIIYQCPNLLLLDEPTNHLDLEMRHTLTMALQDFEGAMVLVSHDRHLLRTVTDDLLLVHQGRVEPFHGDLDDYPRWLGEQRRINANEELTTISSNSAAERKARRRKEAEQRKLLQPLRRQASRLETDIERLTTEKLQNEKSLSNPMYYENDAKIRLKELLQRQAELGKELAEAEEAWLQINEALEAAQDRV
jgi:ATP-binding cassette subfamily F protein 3